MTDDNCRGSAGWIHSIRDMILGLDAPVKLPDGRLAPAINLDNAATTPAFKEVAREVQQQLLYYGSIGRGKGQKSDHSTRVYEQGRDLVKRFVGAESDDYTVVYVNSTTDGMNKLASALVTSPDDVVLSTRMEHHANDLPWRERARMVYAETDERGRLSPGEIEQILKGHSGMIKLVAVTAASNVTGYVNDLHAIARIAHRYGAKIVVDGAQIMAHRPVRMLGRCAEENLDFLVFSAHKMYSPFGGGAIVGLKEVLDAHMPKFYGGGMVELVCDDSVVYLDTPARYEAGSPNYPGVVGMLKAMRLLKRIGFDAIEAHERYLMRYAVEGLKSIPGVVLYGDSVDYDDRLGIVVFNLEGMPCELLADQLAERAAIAVRHAAFCAHPYVSRLEKLEQREGDTPCTGPEGMVRVSFGIYNTREELDCLLDVVWELAQLLCG